MNWRLFKSTALGAFAPRTPQYLILFVTSRCNARCRMCFNWRALDERKGRDDLRIEEIRAIARSLPGLIQLTLSGGEPFLRDDLVEIVEAFCTYSHVRQLTLPTNAILTDRIAETVPAILRRFPGLNVGLDLSIDAIGEDHDAIRAAPGAYAQVLETYRRAREWRTKYPNLRLGMCAVLSTFNQDTIIALMDHMEREFQFDRREVLLARGSTREPAAAQVPIGVFEKAHEWIREHDRSLSRSLYNRVNYQLALMMRETLIRVVKEDRMIVPCLAGSKMIVIDADGTVRPCEILHVLYPDGRPERGLDDFVLGRVRDHGGDVQRIIHSEKAGKVTRFIRESRCYCTFECALFNNLVFNPRHWLELGMRVLLNP